MILKYLSLAVLAVILVTASDPFFGIEFGGRESAKKNKDGVAELPFSMGAIEPFLRDHDGRVSEFFGISPFYYSNVRFWFLMYTKLTSSQVAVHDRDNLSIIYRVLDFSKLKEKELNINARFIVQQKLSREHLEDVKATLSLLAKDPYNMDPESKEIFRAIREAGVDLPSVREERMKFFADLRENLRIQTGQKDFIGAGISRFLPYEKFLRGYLKKRELPPELVAIPFLESSFNPKAHSRVSALGIWQFMPLIGSYYLPKRTALIDYRANVGTASIAAAHLLSENLRIMKRWDLAVTAYNSGTRHILQSKRELASLDEVTLEDIIKHSKSESFGFASKNFYAEFLALAHVLAYEDDLFPGLRQLERKDAEEEELKFYLTKCPLRLDKEVSPELHEEVLFYNDQLKELNKIYPRGTIITTKSDLPSRRFYRVNEKILLKIKPIKWYGLLTNQSCSTR